MPAENDNDSRIENLKEGLYSRNAPDVRRHHHLRLQTKDFNVQSDWEHPPEEDFSDEDLNQEYKKPGMSFFTKLLIGSALFFVLALGIGAYLIWRGSDIVSANNIDINLAGPVSVAGGEPVSFTVQVSNKNSVQLQVVNLDVQYPVGTADPADTTKALKEYQILMPDLNPNSVDQQAISAVLYGEQNSTKTIKVAVDYRVQGSSATFSKEKDFDILINSSPLTLSVNSFTKVNSNQELDLDVSVVSNSNQVVKNLLLNAVYPFGFSFISSTPTALQGNHTIWSIGDLPPHGKQTIHIKGKIQGEDGDVRVFRFAAGAPAQSNSTVKTIGTEYIATTRTVAIEKPFLSVNLALGGDTSIQDFIGQFDQSIDGQVSWFNNTTSAVIDGEIHVSLAGNVLDKGSIDPRGGYYDSANNQIVWNKVTTPRLGSIAAGDGGTVAFSFTPRNLSTKSNPVTNPQMTLAVSAKANRISETNVPEEINSSVSRNIKVSSNAALAEEVVRSIGPFANTGPIPPKAEQTTTYTVIWTVYNTTSTLDGVQVVATLPPYVKWLGNSSPAGTDISYNSVNGQITWNIGNVAVYAGQGSGKYQVAFQLAFNPGADQVGKLGTLVGQAGLTARDDFTGATINTTVQPLSTRFSTDPSFVDGNEIIGQ
ncbi:MAG: hypothetical protein WCQ60_02620 [bacterium]